MDYTEITFRGVELKIGYNYYEGDAGCWRDSNGDGYPSESSRVDIYEMTIKGIDVMELLDEHISEIEEIILNEIEK